MQPSHEGVHRAVPMDCTLCEQDQKIHKTFLLQRPLTIQGGPHRCGAMKGSNDSCEALPSLHRIFMTIGRYVRLRVSELWMSSPPCKAPPSPWSPSLCSSYLCSSSHCSSSPWQSSSSCSCLSQRSLGFLGSHRTIIPIRP